MFFLANKKLCIKVALVLSMCALILWSLLGTGASLAWFSDTSEKITNVFHFADFDIDVSFRDKNGEWISIDGNTDIFGSEDLYEPGFTKVVYLKVENKGNRALNFSTAVSLKGYTEAVNVFGQRFLLQDFLTFGVTFAGTEAEMDRLVLTRDQAREIADTKLKNYSSDVKPLAGGETSYMALVVRMGETVGNEANYRGDKAPQVELGIIVKADQQK